MPRIRFFFAWYDMWIGAYYDRVYRRLYICPLPCCVFEINLKPAYWKTLYQESGPVEPLNDMKFKKVNGKIIIVDKDGNPTGIDPRKFF